MKEYANISLIGARRLYGLALSYLVNCACPECEEQRQLIARYKRRRDGAARRLGHVKSRR